MGLLLGGGALGITYAVARDSAGYLTLTMPVLSSSSPALTAEDAVVATSSDMPSWVLDRLQFDVRMTARPLTAGKTVFLGIAPASSLTAYLNGVAHDQVVGITDARTGGRRTAVLQATPGADRAPAPTSQTFWTVSATGAGQQQLTWRVTGGQWAAVIMNADGSSGVAVDSSIGVRAGFLLPLAFLMLGLGLIATGVAVVLIIIGANGTRRPSNGLGAGPGAPGAPVAAVPPTTVPPTTVAPATVPPDRVVTTDVFAAAAPAVWPGHPRAVSPVALDARLDEPLSRWLWLVKWFLAIPHYIVLVFLWIAFVGRHASSRSSRSSSPAATRAGSSTSTSASCAGRGASSFYCVRRRSAPTATRRSRSADEPDYPARLDIAYPERLSRGLVLVKWWLLAIPHYIIVGLLVGGGTWAWDRTRSGDTRFDVLGGG